MRLAVGPVLGGELRGQGSVYEIQPGVLVSASAAYRVLGPPDDLPFLTFTFALGVSFAKTRELVPGDEEEDLFASDARLGVLFGKTFWNTWSPYLGARVFGGPIAWRRQGEDRTGTDRHHYVLAFGSNVTIPGGFDLTFDGAFLGEKSVAWALSYSF